ncbi:MAG: prephenate dehydrogenase/arogenate dehydrogenase family protein, partial [Aestuariibacter sp.]|nr:prephenate dehydrogenase/arogenate dehydrogenase family protein [Aestuariibacter sp.]
RDVCLSNGEALLTFIDGYKAELEVIAAAVRANDADALLELFGKAKSERDSLVGSC